MRSQRNGNVRHETVIAELGAKVRWFTDLHYAAGSWNRARRVIAKIEHTAKGSNPRYVVTNLKGDGQALYDKLYCARGEMENRIKEQQLDLFADRTSCHRWWPNQFRLLLSSLAYMLLEAIRRLALKGTELGQRLCRHPAPEVTQDRRGDLAQYPADPLPAIKCLSAPATVFPCCSPARTRLIPPYPLLRPR